MGMKQEIRELKKQNKELNDILNERDLQMSKIVEEAMMHGEHLRGEPFIPEYLGFEEVKVENKDTSKTQIYTKGDFNIARGKGKEWVVMRPDKERNILSFDNMHDAIIGLRLSGMDIDFTHLTEDNSIVKTIDESLTDLLGREVKIQQAIDDGKRIREEKEIAAAKEKEGTVTIEKK